MYPGGGTTSVDVIEVWFIKVLNSHKRTDIISLTETQPVKFNYLKLPSLCIYINLQYFYSEFKVSQYTKATFIIVILINYDHKFIKLVLNFPVDQCIVCC